jgi:hypothetical protein
MWWDLDHLTCHIPDLLREMYSMYGSWIGGVKLGVKEATWNQGALFLYGCSETKRNSFHFEAKQSELFRLFRFLKWNNRFQVRNEQKQSETKRKKHS